MPGNALCPATSATACHSLSVSTPEAVVSGTVKDLTGRSSPLSFKQITEQGAVYYIAQFKIDQPETVTFDLNIETGGISNSLSFNQEVFPGE